MSKALMVLMAVIAGLTLVACSGPDNAAYKKGYDAGFSEGGAKKFAEGYEKGLADGKRQAFTDGGRSADSLARDAYDRGYKDGVAAAKSSNPPPPPSPVKVLSQTMTGNRILGELQNVGSKGIDIVLVGALLDSGGKVIGTGSTVWRGYLLPQDKRLFELVFHPTGTAAADFRLDITWY